MTIPTVPVEGLEEAIQKRNEAASSPTGAPKVRPSVVPWLIGGMVGAVAGLEVCAIAAPDPNVQLGCRIGAVALAGMLGIVSPGWRSLPK